MVIKKLSEEGVIMKNLLIRNCKTDDFEYINLIMDEIHKLHVDNRPDIYCETNIVMSKDEFESIVNSDKTISIVAQIDSEVIGLCIISIKDIGGNSAIKSRKVAYMDDLGVLRKYRNQGIGKRLYNEGKKRALEFGVESLELMVWEFNRDAIRFYENEGMKARSRIMEVKLGL